MPKYASFSYSKCNKEHCSTLASCWCRVRQYFFNLWRQQDNQYYVYTESDSAGFPADQEWAEFVSGLPAKCASRSRVEVLDAIRPRLPKKPKQVAVTIGQRRA